jgi:protease IV
VNRVAQARGLAIEQVEEVARGRVWTGADALERGLVDELGGLRTAVRRAKVLAGLDADAEVRLAGYPSSSVRDYLRPKASSQPAAASVSDVVINLLGGAVIDWLNRRPVGGASAVWLGDWRF